MMPGLPVTIVGGYLGSGKTTLVNQLLRNAGGQRIVVLVNEFGDVPIDADLIESDDEGLVSISGGCVCCAFGNDLMGALDRVRAMSRRPDHILIEASGVSLPGQIAAAVDITAGLRTNAIIVLVDAEQIRKNSANPYLTDTIDRQLEQADIFLVTKSDLVSPEFFGGVQEWLANKVPATRSIQAGHGYTSISEILRDIPDHQCVDPSDDQTYASFESVFLSAGEVVDASKLSSALADEPGVVRAKGFVLTPEGTALIQIVGRRCEITPAHGNHSPGLVCIGIRGVIRADRLQAALRNAQIPAGQDA